jgi:hypothetical protein
MRKNNFLKVSEGLPKKNILNNHAKSLVKHKLNEMRLLRSISGIVNLIPDNVLLPYPAEDLFWALYRKN